MEYFYLSVDVVSSISILNLKFERSRWQSSFLWSGQNPRTFQVYGDFWRSWYTEKFPYKNISVLSNTQIPTFFLILSFQGHTLTVLAIGKLTITWTQKCQRFTTITLVGKHFCIVLNVMSKNQPVRKNYTKWTTDSKAFRSSRDFRPWTKSLSTNPALIYIRKSIGTRVVPWSEPDSNGDQHVPWITTTLLPALNGEVWKPDEEVSSNWYRICLVKLEIATHEEHCWRPLPSRGKLHQLWRSTF